MKEVNMADNKEIKNSMEELETLREQLKTLNGEIDLYGKLALRIMNVLLDYVGDLKTERQWQNDLYYKKQAEVDILKNDLQTANAEIDTMKQILGNKN